MWRAVFFSLVVAGFVYAQQPSKAVQSKAQVKPATVKPITVKPVNMGLVVVKVDPSNQTAIKKGMEAVKTLPGVEKVSYANNQISVVYSVPKLGCCMKIFETFNHAGLKYTIIKNQETPPCKNMNACKKYH